LNLHAPDGFFGSGVIVAVAVAVGIGVRDDSAANVPLSKAASSAAINLCVFMMHCPLLRCVWGPNPHGHLGKLSEMITIIPLA
jgi:hypothetical protein